MFQLLQNSAYTMSKPSSFSLCPAGKEAGRAQELGKGTARIGDSNIFISIHKFCLFPYSFSYPTGEMNMNCCVVLIFLPG